MTIQSCRCAVFAFAFAVVLGVGALAEPAFAGCDADVADADLIVAEQMSEADILTLIAATRADMQAPTEQAQR